MEKKLTHEERNKIYKDKRDQTGLNLVAVEIDQLKKTIELTPKVLELIDKFDGKVYNKRFDNALKELDTGLSLEWCGLYGSSFRITYIDWNHRDTKDLTSDCGCRYISPNNFTVVYMDTKDFLDAEHKRMHLTDEGRKRFENYLSSNKEELAKRESLTLEQVNQWREKKEKVLQMIDELYHEVPNFVRGYFDLKTYAQWS